MGKRRRDADGRRIVQVTDLFAGCGGAAQGLKSALFSRGFFAEFRAYEQNKEALDVYHRNHPVVGGHLGDIRKVRDDEIQPADILWASPECTNHTRASGKAEHARCDVSRDLAFQLFRWVDRAEPRLILVENVAEFASSWRRFDEWLREFSRRGFRVEWRVLDALCYGAHTRRVRFYAQAGRHRISWPEPLSQVHAPATDIIDPEEKARSIFRKGYSIAPSSVRKICGGIRKFYLETGQLELAEGWETLDKPPRVVRAPSDFRKQFLIKFYGTATALPLSKPLGTITTVSKFNLVELERQGAHLDIRRRMLSVNELALAQGLDCYDWNGSRVRAINRMLGNSVCPDVARAPGECY